MKEALKVEIGIPELVRRAQSGDMQAKSEIVVMNARLISRIVRKVSRNGPSWFYCAEDLIQEGNIGLLDAISKYDETRGASFEGYASIRVRGAILDYLRRESPLSVSAFKILRNIESASDTLRQKLFREPTHREVRETLTGDSRRRFHSVVQQKWERFLVSLPVLEEAGKNEGRFPCSLGNMSMEEVCEIVKKKVNSLSPRMSDVFWGYYPNEGEVSGQDKLAHRWEVSLGRISQIFLKAVELVRDDLCRNYEICDFDF